MKTIVKNKSGMSSKIKVQHATEEESAHYMYQEDIRREEEAFAAQVKNLTKAELIQLLREAQDEAGWFSAWLLQRNRSQSELKEKLARLHAKGVKNKDNRIQGRQDKAKDAINNSAVAKALGVKDFDGMMLRVTKHYQGISYDLRLGSTKIGLIRQIIVDIVSKENLSAHDLDRAHLEDLIGREIQSSHVDRAERKLKRISGKAA